MVQNINNLLKRMTKSQLANLFTNDELKKLIKNDKSKLNKIASMHTENKEAKKKAAENKNNNMVNCLPGSGYPCWDGYQVHYAPGTFEKPSWNRR